MAEKRKLVVANTCGSEAPSGHGKRILVRRRTPIGPEPPQCVTGADTLAGACLEAVARRVVYVGIQKHGRPIGAKTFKVAGGSSIVSVALEALENEFSFQGVEVDFEYPFIVCDSDKANRTENVRWCMSVQDTMDGKTGCCLASSKTSFEFLLGLDGARDIRADVVCIGRMVPSIAYQARISHERNWRLQGPLLRAARSSK